MSNGILKKILDIQRNLVVTKTGYDERQDFWYWKADDVAAAVRKEMNDVGVIHRVELVEVNDASRIDSNGRERRRLTTTSRIVFIDPEDGSEFTHEVVATGSDVGGDKDTRKVAIQAFKIAAVDIFVVAEGMEKLDSDGDAEAEPEDVSKTAEPVDDGTDKRTVRELGQVVASVTKDDSIDITGDVVRDAGAALAERAGFSTVSTVWRKEAGVMLPLVQAIEAAVQQVKDGEAESAAAAFKTLVTGEVE